MAFDGFVMAALTAELAAHLADSRISKVAMPEKDEILLTFRNKEQNIRLLISAGASLPLIYETESNRPSPVTAPAFCMLLRKHIGTAKVISVEQDGLERILTITFEHYNEIGDLVRKKLIFEMMGKHSNIVFTDDRFRILDSIKRVPEHISSLREVLPGRIYFLPEEIRKRDLLKESRESFSQVIRNSKESLFRTLYTSYAGISPAAASEICFRAGADGDVTQEYIPDEMMERLYQAAAALTGMVKSGDFCPTLIRRDGSAVDFAAFRSGMYEGGGYEQIRYDSMSRLLEDFYSEKDSRTRMRQKSADLRKITSNALERASKKYDIQEKQLKDCAGKEKYRIYGDLINTYGYGTGDGEKQLECENFYDGNKRIVIPLDPGLSVHDNAVRYYNRYAKLSRTEKVLSDEIEKTGNDVRHLSSILLSLDTAADENDLRQIRDELAESGYLRKNAREKKTGTAPKPLHYLSSDGFDIYVGKNNYQNEEVTFRIAEGDDWWFHAKGVPGSHVIVKSGKKEVPDRTFEEAAALAAFFSRASLAEKAEVDYIQRKNVRKAAGGPPGFVIYHSNYSMTISPCNDLKIVL